MPDAQPVASSATPEPVTGQSVLDALTGVQRQSWLETGELPASEPPTPPADPSSAAPPKEPASPEGTPKAASAPAPPDQKHKGAKARSAELDGEIADLREKLRVRALLREELAQTAPPKPDAKPASSPAAETPAWKRYAALPDAPKEAEFESYGDYTAALSLFIADQRFAERETERQTKERQTQAEQTERQKLDTARQRFEQAVEADPAYWDHVAPAVRELQPAAVVLANGGTVTPLNALATEFLERESGPQLMRYFSDHPEALARFKGLTRLDQFFRELAAIEHGLSQPAIVPPKTVTSAPPPPQTLGSRAANADDEVQAALARGDFRGYMAAVNRRELATK